MNSYHHQGIKTLSPKLKIAATAQDGLIEAVYLPTKRFVLAVQWHPEFFAAETPENQRLLHAFLQVCEEKR